MPSLPGLTYGLAPVSSSSVLLRVFLAMTCRWFAILMVGISLGFEKENSAVTEIEVDEVFRLCV